MPETANVTDAFFRFRLIYFTVENVGGHKKQYFAMGARIEHAGMVQYRLNAAAGFRLANVVDEQTLINLRSNFDAQRAAGTHDAHSEIIIASSDRYLTGGTITLRFTKDYYGEWKNFEQTLRKRGVFWASGLGD